MSTTQKSLLLGGFLVLVGAIAAFLGIFQGGGDPPIIIGDGSVTLHHDLTTDVTLSSSGNDIEIYVPNHHARGLTVADGGTNTLIGLKDTNWTIAGADPVFSLTLNQHGNSEGVVLHCQAGWKTWNNPPSPGTNYTCGASRLTPITFTSSGSSTCPDGTKKCAPPCNNVTKNCTVQIAYTK